MYAPGGGGGGGVLVFEVGYHPRKKIHVIRVVFQDHAMYARKSFTGAKTCKIGKKGMFLVISTNHLEMTRHTNLQKNACKNAYLGLIFIPEKYVFRVCFESPFTWMISSLKYKWSPRAYAGFHAYGVLNDEIRYKLAQNRSDLTFLP